MAEKVKTIRGIAFPKVFYGWWVVLAAFTTLFVSMGFWGYNFSVFFKPMLKDLGWSRAKLSLVKTFFSYSWGLSGPFIGKWVIEKVGLKRGMIPAAAVAGLCFSLMYFVNNIWQICFIFMVLGISYATLTYIPCTTAVINWFEERRGTAMGIVVMGVGFGGMVFNPLTGYLISKFGWRATFLIGGLIVWFIIIPVVASLMKDRPEDMGLLKDGKDSDVKTETRAFGQSSSAEGIALGEALKTLRMWFVGTAVFLFGLASVGVLIHLVPFATDIGISPGIAAAVLGGVSGMSLVGRFTYGLLTDKFGARRVMIAGYILLSIIMLLFSLIKSQGLFYPIALLFGFAYAGIIPTKAVFVSELFGTVAYASIYGALQLGMTLGTGSGPVVLGYIYDVTNSYHNGFILFALIYLLGAVLLFYSKKL